jgi:hypothetical protein
MSTYHPQVVVKVGDREAEIDQGIAPLIEEIWKADIDTCLSCQENFPGIMWIDFTSVHDAQRFLNIVARFEEGRSSLYNRIVQYWSAPDEKTEELFWEYDALPMDWNLDESFDDDANTVAMSHPGRPFIRFSLSVRFPQCDYPVVLKRMQRYNERRERRRQGEVKVLSSLGAGNSSSSALSPG